MRYNSKGSCLVIFRLNKLSKTFHNERYNGHIFIEFDLNVQKERLGNDQPHAILKITAPTS